MVSSKGSQAACHAKGQKSSKKTAKKAPGGARLSRARVIKAFEGTGGIISRIAEALKCSRVTVYYYINTFDEVREAYENEKENVLDACEEGLLAKIYSQDMDAIKYYLAYKGRGRGYGARDLAATGEAAGQAGKPSGVLVVRDPLDKAEWVKLAQQAQAEKAGKACK